MFDMSSERLARYTPAQREQVEAATIELYDYIFRALSAISHPSRACLAGAVSLASHTLGAA